MGTFNVGNMLLMFFQLFMAAVVAVGTLALSGISPVIGTTTSAASGVFGALMAAIMALPGIGSLMATATDGFSLAIYITGLVFGVADRSLTPLQLYRPLNQIMTCLSGIYSKVTTIFLIGGPILAVVLLFAFPLLQQGVDDAWCVFDVLFSFLEWIGAVVAPIYNIVAPQMNIFGYYIYLYLSEMAEQLLTYTVFVFTVAVRVITDPGSLICGCHSAPIDTCANFQDITIYTCVPAQLRCALIQLIRFGINTLLYQIVVTIPDIGVALWPLIHDIAWLYIDATTMISQFLANVAASGSCGPQYTDSATVCTMEFDTAPCRPDLFIKIILCRFLNFGQFIPLVVALLEQIPGIGQLLQLMLGLVDLLDGLFNSLIDLVNQFLVILIEVLLEPINLFLEGICAVFWAIDSVNIGGRAPKPCCGWCVQPPSVIIPHLPSVANIIADAIKFVNFLGNCPAPTPPPPPPVRRRRRMLGDEDDLAQMQQQEEEYDLQQRQPRSLAAGSAVRPKPTGRMLPRPTVAKTTIFHQPKPPARTGVPEWDTLRLQSHLDMYGSTGIVSMHGASWLPPWQPIHPLVSAAAIADGVQHAYVPPPWKKTMVMPTSISAAMTQKAPPVAAPAIAPVAAPAALPFFGAVVGPAMTKLGMSSMSDPAMGKATPAFRGRRSLLTITPSLALDYSTGILHILVEVIGGALTLIASAIIRLARWVISNTAGQLGLICRGPISNVILFLPEQLFKLAYGYTPPPPPPVPSGTCSIIGDLLYPVQWILDAAFSVTCSFDVFGVITELDGTFLTAVDAFDIWANNLVLDFLNALPRALQWLQTMLDVLLNLNLNAPFGFIAYLYSLIECSSPGSYNPITNPDPNAYKYGCLLHLLVPPVAPPFPTVSQTIDWGLTCIGTRTNLGSFGGIAYVTIPDGNPIFCKCTEYETCNEKFPSGASVASALFSGAIEWASAIIQGVTADGELAFSVLTLINFEMPIMFNIPPIISIDTVLRPITLIPYAQDFLLCGLDPTTGISLARPLFPGGAAPLTTITPNAGAACVVVRFPAMVKDVIVGTGFLAIFAVSVAIVAAYGSIALNFYYALVVAVFSFITTLFLVVSQAFNRHQLSTQRQDIITLDIEQRRINDVLVSHQAMLAASPQVTALPIAASAAAALHTGAQLYLEQQQVALIQSSGGGGGTGSTGFESGDSADAGYEMEDLAAAGAGAAETDGLLGHVAVPLPTQHGSRRRRAPTPRHRRSGKRAAALGWAVVGESGGWEMFPAPD